MTEEEEDSERRESFWELEREYVCEK